MSAFLGTIRGHTLSANPRRAPCASPSPAPPASSDHSSLPSPARRATRSSRSPARPASTSSRPTPAGSRRHWPGAESVVDVTRRGRSTPKRRGTSAPPRPATSAAPPPRPASPGPLSSRSSASTGCPDNGYYVAKLAQEEAAREAPPGPLVLRATQFHGFAQQMFEWNRDGDVVPDHRRPDPAGRHRRGRPAAAGPCHRRGHARRRARRSPRRNGWSTSSSATPRTSATA